MGAFFGFVQLEQTAAGDDNLAVFKVKLQCAFERQHARFVIYQGQQLHAIGRLERRVFVQLIQHFAGLGTAFQLNHNAHAAPVGFIAHVRDGINAAFAGQFRNAFNQAGFIELVGDFSDDDREAPAAQFFHLRHAAQRQMTAAGAVSLADAFITHNQPTGGEVGAGDAC